MTVLGETDPLISFGDDISNRIPPLAQIETALNLTPRPGRRSSRFRRFGRLFVSDSHLVDEIIRRCWPNQVGGQLPRLHGRSVLSLLHRRMGSVAYDWSTSADAVLFASNLRSFYLGSDQLTVKVKGTIRSLPEFCGDVQARRMVGESRLVKVPAMLHSDMSAADPYVVDQYIAGQRGHWVKHRAVLLNELTPKFWRMYQTFDITLESCRDFFDIEEITRRLKEIPLDRSWTEEKRCRNNLVNIVSSIASCQNEAVICGFGHGDLSVGNLIVTPSAELYVVDWELSGRQPIAWDFRKLLLHVSDVWDRLGALLESEIRCQRWQNVMEPSRQLILSLCAYIAQWYGADGAFPGVAALTPVRSASKTRTLLTLVSHLMRKMPERFATAELDTFTSA